LISPDLVRRKFLDHVRWVTTLFRAVKPDPAIAMFAPRVSTLALIADTIRERLGQKSPSISGVMKAITALLDESIAANGFVMPKMKGTGTIDLAAIDFEKLAKRFAKGQRKSVAFAGASARDFFIGASTCGARLPGGETCRLWVGFAPEPEGKGRERAATRLRVR
jgi:hypothetical protein